MSYVVAHHGMLWFQIRVPSSLQAIHGEFIRVNLQTRDPAVARALALRLASDWLSRFQTDAALIPMDGFQEERPDATSLEDLGRESVTSSLRTPPTPQPSRTDLKPPVAMQAAKPVSDKELLDAWLRPATARAPGTTARAAPPWAAPDRPRRQAS